MDDLDRLDHDLPVASVHYWEPPVVLVLVHTLRTLLIISRLAVSF